MMINHGGKAPSSNQQVAFHHWSTSRLAGLRASCLMRLLSLEQDGNWPLDLHSSTAAMTCE